MHQLHYDLLNWWAVVFWLQSLHCSMQASLIVEDGL